MIHVHIGKVLRQAPGGHHTPRTFEFSIPMRLNSRIGRVVPFWHRSRRMLAIRACRTASLLP